MLMEVVKVWGLIHQVGDHVQLYRCMVVCLFSRLENTSKRFDEVIKATINENFVLHDVSWII